MADKEIKLTIKVDKNDLNKVEDNLDGVNKGLKDVNKNTGAFKKLGSTGKSALTSLGKAGKTAFNGIGTAIKGAGIGLLIGVLATLFEAMKKNQKVMDLFETAINAVGIVVNPIVNAIEKLVTGLISGNEEFDAMGRIIKNVIDLALTPLRIQFESIKIGIYALQLGWLKAKEAFGKDVDQGKIEQLKNDIKASKEEIIELGTEAVDSFKEIVVDAKEAGEEMSTFGKQVVEDVTKAVVSVQNGAAQAATEGKKALESLAQEQEKIKLQGEQEAELLRQKRDNTNLSMEERKEASAQLIEQLRAQQEAEQNIIDKQIAAQQAILALDSENEEQKNKLLELQNKKLEIDARITGQLSEQQAAEIGLNNEVIANLKEQEDIKEANAQKEIDRKNSLNDKLKEIDEALYLESLETDAERRIAELELREQRAIEDLELLNATEAEKQKVRDFYAGKIKDIEDKVSKDKEKVENEKARFALDTATQGFNTLSEIAGKESELGKAAATAGVLTNAAQAVIGTWSGYAGMGVAGTIAAVVQTATIGVAAAKSIREINSVKAPKKEKLATGGYLVGASHLAGGIPMGSKEVEGGEFVVSKAAMNNPQLRGIVESANTAGNMGLSMNNTLTEARVVEIAASVVKAVPVNVIESDITETQRKVAIREGSFTSN